MPGYPKPGRSEFAANEEQAMRKAMRLDWERGLQSAQPESADDARNAAAKTMRKSRAMPDSFAVPQHGEQDD